MSPAYALKRYGIPVLMVLAAFLAFRQMAGLKKEQKRGKPKAFVRKVVTQNIVYGTVRPVITASGRISAWEKVSLAPEVTGIIADESFRLRKGASFTKGDILMKIDDRQAVNTLRSTVSDLQNVLTGMLPELKTDMPDAYDRWQSFFTALGPDDLPEVPAADSEREQLLANRYGVYKLYYTAQNLQLAVNRHTLRAPFFGTVEQSSVYPGDMARTGTAVAVISRTDMVEIELALVPEDAAYIKPGAAARVTVDGLNRPVTGGVHRKSAVLDEKMQTVAVFVRVTDARRAGLNAGAYAVVELTGSPVRHAVSVPRKALHAKNKAYVIENGRLAEKEVVLARTGLTEALVTGGLADGAVLVAEPLQDAVIGMETRSASDPATAGDASGTEKKGGGKK